MVEGLTNSLTSEGNILLPGHLAIIMDGNRRWAAHAGLPGIEGHRAGLNNMRPIIGHLIHRGIKFVTLFAFSTENWNRPREEVDALFHLLEKRIEKEALVFHAKGIKLHHLGQLDGLSPSLRHSTRKALELTKNNVQMSLSFAFNYGGRSEILQAVRRIIQDGIPSESIDENLFNRYLYTNGLPEIDLLIRTGGEFRISNFLIWQMAYSEFYFTDVLWPDFDQTEVEKALATYSQRQRRFGRL